jgi:hypothetical protein
MNAHLLTEIRNSETDRTRLASAADRWRLASKPYKCGLYARPVKPGLILKQRPPWRIAGGGMMADETEDCGKAVWRRALAGTVTAR